MKKHAWMGCHCTKRRRDQAREVGDKALSVFLSLAMALALMPTQAVPALAEELEALSEDAPAVEQTEDGETPSVALEAEENEADPLAAGEGEETPKETEAAPKAQPQPVLRTLEPKGGMLKAPSAGDTVTLEAVSPTQVTDPEFYIDGTTFKAGVEIGIRVTGELISGTDFPTITLTYIDLKGETHTESFALNAETWVVSAPAVAIVTPTASGTYIEATISGGSCASGELKGSAEFSPSFNIAGAEPALDTVTLLADKTKPYEEMVDDSNQVIDLTKLSTRTIFEADAIKVRIKAYALDTSSLNADGYATTRAVLLGQRGTEVDRATFEPEKDKDGNVIENSYIAVLDGREDDGSTLGLPDGVYHIRIAAQDLAGNALEDAETNQHFVVVCGKIVKKSSSDYAIVSDETLVIDNEGPSVLIDYPREERFVGYTPDASAIARTDDATDVSKIDFFNSKPTLKITISDVNLDKDATTVFGTALSNLIADPVDAIPGVACTVVHKTTDVGGGPDEDYARGVEKYVISAVCDDGVYDTSKLVSARDTVTWHEATAPDHLTYDDTPLDITHFVVDTTAPEVTKAELAWGTYDLGNDANGSPIVMSTDGSGNRICIVAGERPDGGNGLTLTIREPYGIRSIEMVDPSGTYGIGDYPDFSGALVSGNGGIVGTHESEYSLDVITTLVEGKEFSDDVSFVITDFAGNQHTWSLKGGKDGKAGSTETTDQPGAADLRAALEGASGTEFGLGHPTLLVPDDTEPKLIVSGPTDRTDAVDPAYVRVFDSDQSLKLVLTELNIRYLVGFTGGDTLFDPQGFVSGAFEGLDPNRSVLTYTFTPDGAGAVAEKRTITVSDIKDNTEDALTYTWERLFTEEGHYTDISYGFADVAQHNATSGTIEDFAIDKTAPVITVDWDPADSAAVNGGYFNSTRTADVTVEEANFDPNLFKIDVADSNTPSDYVPFSYDPMAWNDNGDGTYTYTLNLNTDGAFSVSVTGADKAGNVAEYDGSTLGYATDWFVIDTESPIIAKYVDSDESYDPADLVVVMPERTGEYAGTNYYASIVDLVAQVKDRNLNTEATTLDGEKVTWTTGGRDGDGYETYEITKSYAADGEYQTPHIVAYDMAENASDNADNVRSFVIDLEAPTVAVTADRNPVSQGTNGSSDPYNFYNGATTLTITVSDGHALKNVVLDDPDGYTVSWDKNPLGEKQVVGTVTLREYGSSADEFDRAIILTATDIAGNERTWSIDHEGTVTQVTGPSAANASINDNGEHPVLLVKDTTAPVIGLSGATAGQYYNTSQTVVATVNELLFDYLQMFDGGRTIVTVTKYEGNAGRAMSTWTVPASSFGGSKPNYSFSQDFSSDGHYVVTAQFRDYAENLSNEATIGEFTIDMTSPQLSMEFDNNDVRNDMYYKATRTATITVVEHNFDPSLFTIDTTGSIGGWSDNGDTHTCTVFFDEGGPYTITVGGKDLAGNEAISVSEPEFIVDLTAPEVTIAGTAQRLGYVGEDGILTDAYHDELEDKSAYNGVVVPVITYTDNEVLSSADLGHTLAGSKHGEEVEHQSAMSEEGQEMTVTLRDLGYVGDGAGDGSNWERFYVDDYDVDSDDIYTIKATMTDQAGNEAEAELTFSVNRYGSNYDVQMQDMSDEELEEYERSGMLSEAPTIVVREVNVSGVADTDADGNVVPDNHHVVKEFANATTAIDMRDGDGLGYDLQIVSSERALNGWSEYVYTVRRANFGEGSDSDHNDRGQGVYRVNVMSDDTSSNANTTADYWRSDENRTKVEAAGATAKFILDELAPTIDELDLPEHLSAGESYEASFHVTDDITSGNTVEVILDGQTLDASEVKGPRSGVGTFSFTVPAKSFNWHRSIKIVVRDYAGREVTASNGSWIWQSSFIPEGMAAAGIVAAGVAGALAVRKRRLAAEPELPE